MKNEKLPNNETVYKINAHVILLRNEPFNNMHFQQPESLNQQLLNLPALRTR